MPAPASVTELIARFRLNRDQYTQPGYKEAQLRQEFVDPLFEALGWDMANRLGYAEAYKDVIHEASLRVGGAIKAPDYCMRVGGTPKFYVEAKKPVINLRRDADAAFQLRRYAWSAGFPLSILTNFDVLAVYDTTLQPAAIPDPAVARVLLFSFEEYEGRWKELYSLFSKDAIQRGLFDRFVRAPQTRRGTSLVNDAFLYTLDHWRSRLASHLAMRNPSLNEHDLNWGVQQTIDRIVFLRICEDRGIEPYGSLRDTVKLRGAYAALGNVFRAADDKFNSGLFHFRAEPGRESPDTLTLGLAVDDIVLREIIAKLYYPESPFEFSVIPADILGQVYEQFLGKVITLAAGRVTVQSKPEVAKAGGVFYTPTHIVNYIIQRTIHPVLSTSTVDAMHSAATPVRILDPACGSGSFLLGAYDLLLRWYLDEYSRDVERWSKGPDASIREHAGGGWRLTTRARKGILLRHIFGVDLDQQAVEVTKLSLLLKVLEGESEAAIAEQLSVFHERALPDLAANIKSGNSLVGPDYNSGRFGVGLPRSERAAVKPFDWSREFPGAAGSGGFDVVVGNPPWLMAGYYVKPSLRYFQAKYQTARGKYDLYYLFLEKALSLASSTGRIGMIVPNKFFHSTAARQLRALLTATGRIESVDDFGASQVFARATNYSSILILSGAPVTTLRMTRRLADLTEAGELSLPALPAGAAEWQFPDSLAARVFTTMEARGVPLQDVVAHFGNGVQTGADKVLLLTPAQAAAHAIEPAALVPFLRGRDVRRYRRPSPSASLLFCYRVSGDRYTVIDADGLEALPKAKGYLSRNKSVLDSRLWFGKSATELSGAWYGLMYLDAPSELARSHLVTPALAQSPNFTINAGALFATGTAGVTGVAPPNGAESIEYLVGLLNSTLMAFYTTAHSPIYQGGYHKFSAPYLRHLPVRRIDPSVPGDKAVHDQIRELVSRRFLLTVEMDDATTPPARTSAEREAQQVEEEVDDLVFGLYGIDRSDRKDVIAAETARLAAYAPASRRRAT